MNLQHHLNSETLIAYAAGTLSAPLALVVSCHTEICSKCRRALNSAEAIGGQLLSTLEAKPLSAGARESVLSRLDDMPISAPSVLSVRRNLDNGGLLPYALASLLKVDNYDQVRWRKLGPGIEKFDLPFVEGKFPRRRHNAFLLRISPGKAMPVHGHHGSEMTLLLQGGYHDKLGHYQAGDVADLDSETVHQPISFDDQPCICLAGINAGLAFNGLIATLMKPMTGL